MYKEKTAFDPLGTKTINVQEPWAPPLDTNDGAVKCLQRSQCLTLEVLSSWSSKSEPSVNFLMMMFKDVSYPTNQN